MTEDMDQQADRVDHRVDQRDLREQRQQAHRLAPQLGERVDDGQGVEGRDPGDRVNDRLEALRDLGDG